jgi:hypothetical protein
MELAEDLKVDIPAVADHAHAFGLSHPVELGALLEVFFAANALSIAKACLSQGIDIAPIW